MKTVSDELKAHIEGGLHSLRTCWKIKRTDGVIQGFTNHSRDIEVDGITYETLGGIFPSTFKAQEGSGVNNLEICGFLKSDIEDDLEAGKFDFARVEIFQVNYRDLSPGILKQTTGFLGNVTRQTGKFVAEIRGLTQQLDVLIGRVINANCDAVLGDDRCGVKLDDTVFSAAVDFNAPQEIHLVSDEADWFTSGLLPGMVVTITGTSSNNGTRTIESMDNRNIIVSGTVSDEDLVTATLTYSPNFRFTRTVDFVNDVSPKRTFGDTTLTGFANGWFTEGTVEFTTGPNTGFIRDVRNHTGTTFSTKIEFPYDITVGDEFILTVGCQKRMQDCRDKFANWKNFRGFPYVPTNEDILESPAGLL